MALFNYTSREINAKIVYYGPGLSGKTTNIQYIYEKIAPDKKGKLITLPTYTDRTLFFDFFPLEAGEVRGYRIRFHLYTVPGQVFYNATRRLVLKGADGVVFVADSQDNMLDANIESMNNLRENLREMGIDLDHFPLVIQYNKRDLPNVLPVETLNRALNPRGVPWFEASATKGEGVLETLKAICQLVLRELRESLEAGKPLRPSPALSRTPSVDLAVPKPASVETVSTKSDIRNWVQETLASSDPSLTSSIPAQREPARVHAQGESTPSTAGTASAPAVSSPPSLEAVLNLQLRLYTRQQGDRIEVSRVEVVSSQWEGPVSASEGSNQGEG